MAIVVWLIVGGIIGWLASLILRSDTQMGIVLNIVVGIMGAVIAGLLLAGGVGTTDPLDLTNILWSLVGAVILLAAFNFVRKLVVR